ncbi:hypothetical protein Pmani_022141 [Petrolisthes manimaculis]|uniref:Protein mab-21-like 3 n=2 Tax=Petrolisthes TaxID=84661 RepID=A0AAE1EJ26_PETCI|nr:hypothetical protein Pcinc_039452 [Petrolisthes cinctipes]KAK3877438.1 hypothetical protein Pcinc_017847 [Petrolisthes cinctipes]KAK4306008.1 hypothetical protein Pmani_022141 [Petrolisthes manimaculis]
MLVPSDGVSSGSGKLVAALEQFYSEQVAKRRMVVNKRVEEVVQVAHDLMKHVEAQEPRCLSTLTQAGGRWEGLHILSPHEYQVTIYLNQMGEFNLVDDGTVPGSAVLKLSDGRKRSMSLWVEFITASGYLSSRKMRARFQTLVAQAVEKSQYRDQLRMVGGTSEVRVRIRDTYTLDLTLAFKCYGIWPRSAAHWPELSLPWPGVELAAEVKMSGFTLVSRDCTHLAREKDKDKQDAAITAEGDTWVMVFMEAEDRLLTQGCRKKCLSILKTLRDRHLDLPGNPVSSYVLKTLVLYECEKHPHEWEWDTLSLGDRINGILLQLISCLLCRRCPHYFLPQVDLFRGSPRQSLTQGASQTWRLTRDLLTRTEYLQQC